MTKVESIQVIMLALSNAQKGIMNVQKTLTDANPLAAQIPMYDRLNKIVSELKTMMIDAQRLPL